MKKSQIFLGTSAFVLALAGALASKASHRLPVLTAGTKGSMGNGCASKQVVAATTVNHGGVRKHQHTAAGVQTLYTAHTNAQNVLTCGKTLYTFHE